ncbi:MAG: nucleotidyltransferase [bacterium]
MTTTLDNALFKFVSILDELNINYAIIGAIASGIYGIPRTTYDIDIILNIEKIKISIFLEMLKDKGFNFDMEYILNELKKGYLLEVYYKDARIDILLPVIPYFNNVIENASTFSFLDRNIRFAKVEDLIILKLLSNRGRDKDDVVGIKDINPSLNISYIKDSLRRLVGKKHPSFVAFEQIFEEQI